MACTTHATWAAAGTSASASAHTCHRDRNCQPVEQCEVECARSELRLSRIMIATCATSTRRYYLELGTVFVSSGHASLQGNLNLKKA
eukprot:953567-Rhodomonas_salina.2